MRHWNDLPQLAPSIHALFHTIVDFNSRRVPQHRFFIAVALVALLLTACGPEKPSDEQMRSETIRIAQEYEQTGDLSRARVQLDSLAVANPTQWLILLAESRALEAASAPETTALVRLSLALGLQSNILTQYAMQHGLIAAPAPTPTTSVLAAVPVVQPPQPAAAAEVPGQTAAAPETATPEPPTPEPPTPEPPTATPVPIARVQASNAMNVRSGPGTAYPIVGALRAGEQADILGKNPQGDWWQIALPTGQSGWVFGALVQTSGDLTTVAVASNIPEPPPTPTPAPVVAAPPPAEAPPAPAAPPPPPGDGPDFVVIERRLWNVYETGGRLDGPSVICGEKRELHVNVVDINGVRLNGVAVQAEYGAREIFVTGSQGKGDGKAEFVLGRGQDVRVIRDVDGREVTSEVARGMSTETAAISYDDLRSAQYCTDDESCRKFVAAPGCWGHFSWTVTFQRRY